MTLDEIKQMNKETLTPAIVGSVLGCNPHYIRLQARAAPEKLGFEVHIHGTRTLIPRRAFIRFMEGG